MTERLLGLLVFGAVLAVAILAIRRWNRHRTEAIQSEGPDWEALGERPDGRRTLIAFSTPSCAACHTAQKPAIEAARQSLGGEDAVRLIHVDTAQQPAAARAFGILTVPSTVVVAAEGRRIVAVNQGFAPSKTLLVQLKLAA